MKTLSYSILQMQHLFPPTRVYPLAAWEVVLHFIGMALVLSFAFGLWPGWKSHTRRQRVGTLIVITVLLGVPLALDLSDVFFRYPLKWDFRVLWFPVVCAGLTSLFHSVFWKSQRGNSTIVMLLISSTLVVITQLTACPPTHFTDCRSLLRGIGLAFHNYHDINGRFPDAIYRDKNDLPISWRVKLLPYLDESSKPIPYDRNASWDDAANLKTAQNPRYRCPANVNPVDELGRSYTAYALFVGANGSTPNGKGLPISAYQDGLSQTLVAGEACGLNIVWTEPRDIDSATQPVGVNLNGDTATSSSGTLSSYHIGGAQALFGDGSVRKLSEKISPEVLRAMMTPAAHDVVDEAAPVK